MAKVTYVQSYYTSATTSNYSSPIMNTGIFTPILTSASSVAYSTVWQHSATISRLFGYRNGTYNNVYRKNGSDTDTVTLTANTLSENNSDTESIAATDTLSIKMATTNSSILTYFQGHTIEPASGHFTMVGSFGSSSSTENSTTRYIPAQTAYQAAMTDNVTYRLPVDINVTAKNFFVVVTTNARSTNSTYGVRVNTSNGNGVIVISAGATGHMIDTSNTDSLVPGDTFNYFRTTLTGGGALATSQVGIELHSDNVEHHMYGQGSSITDRPVIDSTTINYLVPFGGLSPISTTEARHQVPMGHSGTATTFRVYLAANTAAGGGTITIRKNGTDVATITITASTLGVFSDTSSSFTFVAGDLISASAVAGGGGGEYTIAWMSMVISQGGASRRIFLIT